MIQRLYYALWRRILSVPAAIMFWPRMAFGKKLVLIGLPVIRGDVRFGKNTILASLPMANPLGLYRRCIFEAINKNGQIGVIRVGNNFSASGVCVIAQSSIIIGDNVTIGANATIIDTDFHPLTVEDRRENRMGATRPVIIENDVWIGAGALILKGVTIGSGAIIAAQTVVSKNVPDGCLVAGNPGRIVRYPVGEL